MNANIAHRSLTAKQKLKNFTKTYILSLQKVAQSQFLALGEGLREERSELSFQDDSLLDRQAITHRHAEIGILIDHIEFDVGEILLEKLLGSHSTGTRILSVIEENAEMMMELWNKMSEE